jgi:hypothetical protein
MAAKENGPEKCADISHEHILEHPEMYERVVCWTNKIRGEFHLTYKKRED